MSAKIDIFTYILQILMLLVITIVRVNVQAVLHAINDTVPLASLNTKPTMSIGVYIETYN
jgi:hypothetical protein